jgi:hypothetical protein
MYKEYQKYITHLVDVAGFSTAQILQGNLNHFKILFSDEKANLKLTKSFFCKTEDTGYGAN